MQKLIIVVTVPLVLETWLKGQARFLAQFYDVEIITSNGPSIQKIEKYERVSIKIVDFNRKINLFKDMKVLLSLIWYFIHVKPDAIYTLTPKAGLLGILSAWLTLVPIRIHNVVGLPHLEARGKKKIILTMTEKITYWFSTNVYCNSRNLKLEMESNLTNKLVKVIGNGSINGVDTEYFRDSLKLSEKKMIRKQLSIKEGDFVITFVGRIVRDKGVNELIQAFCALNFSNVKLLLVGDYEDDLDPISDESKKVIQNHHSIIQVNFQEDIRRFLAVTDLFALPSYREGLPNVLLEAGSYGIPLLATDINGCNEIINHKKNGVLVKPKDIQGLHQEMNRFICDEYYYKMIKSKVRDSIKSRYSQRTFLKSLREEFLSIFKRHYHS